MAATKVVFVAEVGWRGGLARLRVVAVAAAAADGSKADNMNNMLLKQTQEQNAKIQKLMKEKQKQDGKIGDQV